jgi:hypothetical protein
LARKGQEAVEGLVKPDPVVVLEEMALLQVFLVHL